MKNIKHVLLTLVVLLTISVVCAFTYHSSIHEQKSIVVAPQETEQNQTISLFVTHGHCSLPFAGRVDNLEVKTSEREDQGNPLEDMQISFEINPESFNVCASEELTERIKTPGLFINGKNENIIFRSTNVHIMGLDWYQVNGTMSIKGVEKEVKFFVSGIRDSNESMASSLVLEGQLNLNDWGIDYEKIVNGESNDVPTKWLHFNMKIKLS